MAEGSRVNQISVGRAIGHTTAATDLFRKYNSVLFVPTYFMAQNIYHDLGRSAHGPNSIENIISLESLNREDAYRGIRPTDFYHVVLVDNASSLTDDKMQMLLHHHYVNTPFILLG